MAHADRPLFAISLRIAAMLLIATMFMLVKYVGEAGVATPEIMFWRQAVTIPLILGWLWSRGELAKLHTRRLASHASRAGAGMAAMGLNFFAIVLLPLAEATTLNFTSPLFAVLLTAFLPRESVGPWRWSAVLLGFIGVIVIAQPSGTSLPPLGVAAGLTGGLMVTVVSFQIRGLARTEHPLACVLYFALFGGLMMALLLPFYATAHRPFIYLLLLGIGLIGTMGQLLLTLSLKYGPVATVVVMDYSALVWATFYGWLVWDRLPAPATWAGALAIVAAGVIITWREHRHSRSISSARALEAD